MDALLLVLIPLADPYTVIERPGALARLAVSSSSTARRCAILSRWAQRRSAGHTCLRTRSPRRYPVLWCSKAIAAGRPRQQTRGLASRQAPPASPSVTTRFPELSRRAPSSNSPARRAVERHSEAGGRYSAVMGGCVLRNPGAGLSTDVPTGVALESAGPGHVEHSQGAGVFVDLE